MGLSEIGRCQTTVPLMDAHLTTLSARVRRWALAFGNYLMGGNEVSATIFVRFVQPGFHAWPDGPEHLKHTHRHLFHVEVRTHKLVDNDRTIEFHELLEHSKCVFRDLAVRGTMYDFGDNSCETIAHWMSQRLANAYSQQFTVMISEDGECGAIVKNDPQWNHQHRDVHEEFNRDRRQGDPSPSTEVSQ